MFCSEWDIRNEEFRSLCGVSCYRREHWRFLSGFYPRRSGYPPSAVRQIMIIIKFHFTHHSRCKKRFTYTKGII